MAEGADLERGLIMPKYRVWLPTPYGMRVVRIHADSANDLSRKAPTERLREIHAVRRAKVVARLAVEIGGER